MITIADGDILRIRSLMVDNGLCCSLDMRYFKHIARLENECRTARNNSYIMLNENGASEVIVAESDAMAI